MAGDRVADVIGETCDYGACAAPVRVRVEFVFGDLQLCQHHWHEAADLVAESPTFLTVQVNTAVSAV
ncbi:MAG TPA: hypothetical protein VG452_05195 [Egibacteraceae bacterium]|nr:hypothetical protein [Egibacteraceae bacterium]